MTSLGRSRSPAGNNRPRPQQLTFRLNNRQSYQSSSDKRDRTTYYRYQSWSTTRTSRARTPTYHFRDAGGLGHSRRSHAGVTLGRRSQHGPAESSHGDAALGLAGAGGLGLAGRGPAGRRQAAAALGRGRRGPAGRRQAASSLGRGRRGHTGRRQAAATLGQAGRSHGAGLGARRGRGDRRAAVGRWPAVEAVAGGVVGRWLAVV